MMNRWLLILVMYSKYTFSNLRSLSIYNHTEILMVNQVNAVFTKN
jgi:hypothetical protein